jgi:hypothetical protein
MHALLATIFKRSAEMEIGPHMLNAKTLLDPVGQCAGTLHVRIMLKNR